MYHHEREREASSKLQTQLYRYSIVLYLCSYATLAGCAAAAAAGRTSPPFPPVGYHTTTTAFYTHCILYISPYRVLYYRIDYQPSSGRPFAAYIWLHKKSIGKKIFPLKMLGMFRRSSAILVAPLLYNHHVVAMEGSKNKAPEQDISTRMTRKKYKDISVIAGSASRSLTKDICKDLGIDPIETTISRNDNGEILFSIDDSVRESDVFVIQTCAAPVNDNFMELLFSVSAAKRAGASSVTAVVPYFGYKHHKRGLPMSTTHHSRFLWSAAGDMGKMLQQLGADKIISIDLQRPGQGHEACFFVGNARLPTETISTIELFVEHFAANIPLSKSIVVVAPNTDYVKKGLKFQKKLRSALGPGHTVEFAEFIEVDDSPVNSSQTRFIGRVNEADVIIVQDVIDSAEEISSICFRLRKEGAKRIFLCASHGNFTKASFDRIALSPVEKVLISDSIELPRNAIKSSKIEQVSSSYLLSQLIRADSKRIFEGSEFIEEEESDENTFELEE